MEEAALKIDYSNHDEQVKAYSIFFLNVAYIDASTDQSFDFLLKDHSKHLPLDLSLALIHEFEDIKKRTLLMKKHEKHVKKVLKFNTVVYLNAIIGGKNKRNSEGIRFKSE